MIGVLDVEGAKDGILFFGTHGRQANPWGNGSSFQCVTPPVSRTGLQASVGTPGQCNGFFGLDFNTWMTPNPLRAPATGTGTTVQAQCWFRDPLSTSNQTTSLPNALEFESGL